MNSNLDKLNDIIVPAPVSFWPPADGWFVLLLVIVSFMIPLSVWAYQRYRAGKYRRSALIEIDTIRRITDPKRKMIKLFDLLKRTALSIYEREQVAPLSGDAWWDFLTRQSGVDFAQYARKPFCREVADVLYNPSVVLSRESCEQFLKDVKNWIKHHNVNF